ncbi:MAG: hypothetical protein JWR15_3297 [Prosthecobacter sp.]|nr:hypothetical protein [Prosthecobacter sp.]
MNAEAITSLNSQLALHACAVTPPLITVIDKLQTVTPTVKK